MKADWCDECQMLLRCDCSKLETARIKDVGFGDDMTATIYITYCPICREKHDVSFTANDQALSRLGRQWVGLNGKVVITNKHLKHPSPSR